MLFLYLLAILPIVAYGAKEVQGDVKPQPMSYIVGGSSTTASEFPSMAHILLQGNSRCGGAILNENWIITAGHCLVQYSNSSASSFVKLPVESFSLVFGSTQNIKTNSVPIKRYILHDQFDLVTSKNDLGLIELQSPIQFSDNIKPATIGSIPKVNQNVTTVGFGETETQQQSPTLLKLNLTIGSTDFCMKSIGETKNDPTIFCTKPMPGKAPCFGDSGSPVYGSGKLIGLTSYGVNLVDPLSDNCGISGEITYFVNINNYKQFLSIASSTNNSQVPSSISSDPIKSTTQGSNIVKTSDAMSGNPIQFGLLGFLVGTFMAMQSDY
ncbi:trypsin-like serine protease [Basidiobolus meristosporus CBS 931.73]|uniref:Trypsin-like serine protease n=1 Tax=Basidiobolus meristosporus CBS 931.73 TaxID=1314790 RepID=A0A1Y1XV53_9FUNG|nr:trypsin-like serine protease [Basidiobolus meristosporus CBS 931.73]|eukprot:ORX89154.1 trypsin-like serine protease [Basidiobolus meristosporus CBS 931.73]